MSPRKVATAPAVAQATAKAAVKRSAAAKPAAGGKPAAVKPSSAKPVAAKPVAAKPFTAKPAAAGNGTTSAEAVRLAGEIERAVLAGKLDVLDQKAVQTLMAALCKLYGMQVEAGQDFLPLEGRQSVSPTEVMTTTSGILKAANLAVFELGMWQSWTGR